MKVQAAEMPGRNRLNSNSEFSREAENLTIPATIASRTGKGLPNYGQRFTLAINHRYLELPNSLP
jgi:hypothetical protein